MKTARKLVSIDVIQHVITLITFQRIKKKSKSKRRGWMYLCEVLLYRILYVLMLKWHRRKIKITAGVFVEEFKVWLQVMWLQLYQRKCCLRWTPSLPAITQPVKAIRPENMLRVPDLKLWTRRLIKKKKKKRDMRWRQTASCWQEVCFWCVLKLPEDEDN